MDPLSLLASIAGVATAGVQVSKAIYDMIFAIRGIPKEVSDIARGLSDLSLVLRELRRALKEGRELYRHKLLHRVGSAIRRIGQIHAEIRKMIAGMEGLAALKWLFLRARTAHLLYQIESHKNGINMILHIMTLAVQAKTLLRRPTKSPELPFDSGGQDKDKKAERDLLRQQAENLVQVSYQSLRDAMFQQGETDQADQADETVPEPDETQPAQLQLRREASERHNTAQWLCDLVFSSYVESLSGNLPTPSRGDKSDAEAGPGGPGGSGHTDGAFGMELSTSVSSIPERMQLATIIQTPVEVPTVVVELLAEWTTLTENEIAGVVEAEPVRLEPEFPSGIINFEDALGRKWKFPYQKCQTWAGFRNLAIPAFLSFESHHRRHQMEMGAHYKFVRPTGDMITPLMWEHAICPGDTIRMIMWLPPGTSSVEKRSPPNREEVEKTQDPKTVAIPPKESQVENRKATTSSQKIKSQSKEKKKKRDNRKKPTSGTKPSRQS